MPVITPATEAVESRVTVADTQQLEQVVTRPRYAVLDLQALTVTHMRGFNVSAPTPEEERAFAALAAQWRAEIRHLSSDTDITGRFAYHQIIGMGARALPLIFRQLQEHGGPWFWALRAITRENPVRPEDRGSVRRMTEAWLDWGRQRGHVR